MNFGYEYVYIYNGKSENGILVLIDTEISLFLSNWYSLQYDINSLDFGSKKN